MTSSDYGTDESQPQRPRSRPRPAPDECGDTLGVPAGSAEPIGESDFVDGAEVSD